jgi:hypothetical protein
MWPFNRKKKTVVAQEKPDDQYTLVNSSSLSSSLIYCSYIPCTAFNAIGKPDADGIFLGSIDDEPLQRGQLYDTGIFSNTQFALTC